MKGPDAAEWRELLLLFLSQRLELNALETALKRAGVVTDEEMKRIRTQSGDTAKAWSREDTDDVLRLLRIHSSPRATMLVPPDAS